MNSVTLFLLCFHIVNALTWLLSNELLEGTKFSSSLSFCLYLLNIYKISGPSYKEQEDVGTKEIGNILFF